MSQQESSSLNALNWVSSVVSKHVGKNIRRYYTYTYAKDPQRGSFAGNQIDLKPQTGTVVNENEQWLLLKTGPKDFFVADKSLLLITPTVGSKVTITPYSRRRFDGQRLDAPISDVGGVKSYILFNDITHITCIDKDKINSIYLSGMIEQIEKIKIDSYRTIAQAMIDYGALQGVECDNPTPDQFDVMAPAIRFRVSNELLDGWLEIKYDLGHDTYQINTFSVDKSRILQSIDYLHFTDLGDTILNLIDDEKWIIANVEVIKAAKKAIAA